MKREPRPSEDRNLCYRSPGATATELQATAERLAATAARLREEATRYERDAHKLALAARRLAAGDPMPAHPSEAPWTGPVPR